MQRGEGDADELLMTLIIIKEAAGEWVQAAGMLRWTQKVREGGLLIVSLCSQGRDQNIPDSSSHSHHLVQTQPSLFSNSREAHAIIFELMFRLGGAEGLRQAVVMCGQVRKHLELVSCRVMRKASAYRPMSRLLDTFRIAQESG